MAFAVIGSWPVAGALREEDLAHIVENVRAQPGFVAGHWGQDPRDTTRAHAVVVLADEPSARGLADGIASAIPSATVHCVELLASA